MKFSQKLWMDVISNQTKPYHIRPNQTIPYHTKPTVNIFQNSQNKSDYVETFSVTLDGCYLKPDQTIPKQTKP